MARYIISNIVILMDGVLHGIHILIFYLQMSTLFCPSLVMGIISNRQH